MRWLSWLLALAIVLVASTSESKKKKPPEPAPADLESLEYVLMATGGIMVVGGFVMAVVGTIVQVGACEGETETEEDCTELAAVGAIVFGITTVSGGVGLFMVAQGFGRISESSEAASPSFAPMVGIRGTF